MKMENITELDILTPIQEQLNNGRLFMTEGEEKIDISGHPRFTQDFILHKGVGWHKCYMWHKFWFTCYGIVPIPCQNYCWKIVVKPQTLFQLIQLYALQQKLNFPSKCGIEGRPFVDGLYGGYFYNTGIREGRERYWIVREAVSDCISPDVPVILKRACSEYEHIFGPSDEWRVTRKQQLLEKMLNERWVQHDYYCVPGKHRRAQIITNWFKWAALHGDDTYLNYVDKPFNKIELGMPQKPVMKSFVTYHGNSHEAEIARHKAILYRQF
jgi:hypothetical protein